MVLHFLMQNCMNSSEYIMIIKYPTLFSHWKMTAKHLFFTFHRILYRVLLARIIYYICFSISVFFLLYKMCLFKLNELIYTHGMWFFPRKKYCADTGIIMWRQGGDDFHGVIFCILKNVDSICTSIY